MPSSGKSKGSKSGPTPRVAVNNEGERGRSDNTHKVQSGGRLHAVTGGGESEPCKRGGTSSLGGGSGGVKRGSVVKKDA